MFHSKNDDQEEPRLDFSQINLVPVELSETIIHILQDFDLPLKQKHLHLILELPKNLVLVKTDPRLISQVIVKLMSNAIKFTEYGSITLATAVEPDFDPLKEKITIHFVIKDTGIGMSLPEINHLFLRFSLPNENRSSTEDGSAGGFSSCKKIVELLGGIIQIESTLGEGTQVSFSIKCSHLKEQELLDALQTKRLHFKKRPSLIPSKLHGKNILIIDSNQVNSSILVNQLTLAGCLCHTSSDSQQTLEQLAQNRFDLILIGSKLRGDDSLHITRQIRQKEAQQEYSTPIIGFSLSEYSSQTTKMHAIQGGMNDFLTTPYTQKNYLK